MALGSVFASLLIQILVPPAMTVFFKNAGQIDQCVGDKETRRRGTLFEYRAVLKVSNVFSLSAHIQSHMHA